MPRVLAEEETEGIQQKDEERHSEFPSWHKQGNHAWKQLRLPSFVQDRPYHPIVSWSWDNILYC